MFFKILFFCELISVELPIDRALSAFSKYKRRIKRNVISLVAEGPKNVDSRLWGNEY
jgi:hypothetical protein